MPDSRDSSGKPLPPEANRFKPGQSGNPGGKSPEREELRRYTVDTYGKESIDGIAELGRKAKSEKVRLDARVWIAEHAIGKAVQAVSGPDGAPLVDVPAILAALERASKAGSGG